MSRLSVVTRPISVVLLATAVVLLVVFALFAMWH